MTVVDFPCARGISLTASLTCCHETKTRTRRDRAGDEIEVTHYNYVTYTGDYVIISHLRMMACLLRRIGTHADVRYGAVHERWQGLGAWRAGLIKLSHDYCNLIGSHNIPRLHTESQLQSPDVPSPPRTSGPRD